MDDPPDIPVQLPSEMVNRITEQAKESTATGDPVTITFPAKNASQFTELRKDLEAYQRSQVEELHSVIETFIKISQLRIAFYEKLILLAGGSFALSLTFLGFFQQHEFGGRKVSLRSLKWAWALLLISIVFSWLHNLYRCAEVDHLVATTVENIKAIQYGWISNLMTRTASLFRQGAESPAVGLFWTTTSISPKTKPSGRTHRLFLKSLGKVINRKSVSLTRV